MNGWKTDRGLGRRMNGPQQKTKRFISSKVEYDFVSTIRLQINAHAMTFTIPCKLPLQRLAAHLIPDDLLQDLMTCQAQNLNSDDSDRRYTKRNRISLRSLLTFA